MFNKNVSSTTVSRLFPGWDLSETMISRHARAFPFWVKPQWYIWFCALFGQSVSGATFYWPPKKGQLGRVYMKTFVLCSQVPINQCTVSTYNPPMTQTRRYGSLTFSSLQGLWPSAKAFLPLRPKRACYFSPFLPRSMHQSFLWTVARGLSRAWTGSLKQMEE